MKGLLASAETRSSLPVGITLILIACLAAAPASAASFGVDGIVHVLGNGLGTVYRIHNGPEETAYSDYAEVAGSNGQLAISKYYANLATGQIGAYSYARSDFDQYARSASAATNIQMQDTLNFHVPAGTYPDGLFVTLYGSIGGVFSSSGQAEERGRFQVIFQNDTYDLADYNDWGSYNASVGDTFALTETILPPSPNPRPELTVSKHLTVTLSAGRPLGASALRTLGYGEAVADFYDTIQISSLAAPAGVTWDSASGVFLTQIPVPEPATILLLGSGLLGLTACGRKKFFGK